MIFYLKKVCFEIDDHKIQDVKNFKRKEFVGKYMDDSILLTGDFYVKSELPKELKKELDKIMEFILKL